MCVDVEQSPEGVSLVKQFTGSDAGYPVQLSGSMVRQSIKNEQINNNNGSNYGNHSTGSSPC
jgi:hypothetical protein